MQVSSNDGITDAFIEKYNLTKVKLNPLQQAIAYIFGTHLLIGHNEYGKVYVPKKDIHKLIPGGESRAIDDKEIDRFIKEVRSKGKNRFKFIKNNLLSPGANSKELNGVGKEPVVKSSASQPLETGTKDVEKSLRSGSDIGFLESFFDERNRHSNESALDSFKRISNSEALRNNQIPACGYKVREFLGKLNCFDERLLTRSINKEANGVANSRDLCDNFIAFLQDCLQEVNPEEKDAILNLYNTIVDQGVKERGMISFEHLQKYIELPASKIKNHEKLIEAFKDAKESVEQRKEISQLREGIKMDLVNDYALPSLHKKEKVDHLAQVKELSDLKIIAEKNRRVLNDIVKIDFSGSMTGESEYILDKTELENVAGMLGDLRKAGAIYTDKNGDTLSTKFQPFENVVRVLPLFYNVLRIIKFDAITAKDIVLDSATRDKIDQADESERSGIEEAAQNKAIELAQKEREKLNTELMGNAKKAGLTLNDLKKILNTTDGDTVKLENLYNSIP